MEKERVLRTKVTAVKDGRKTYSIEKVVEGAEGRKGYLCCTPYLGKI